MHFDKPGEKFSTQGRKTYAHWPKMKKEIKFDEKIFPQKCSFGNVKCNFVNPIGRSSLEGRSYYGRFPMINKKSFFLSSLFGDCFSGLWECSFLTDPTKVPCKKGGSFSVKVLIWNKMRNFLGTVSFPLTWSSAYAEFIFDNLVANFRANDQKIFDDCPKTV